MRAAASLVCLLMIPFPGFSRPPPDLELVLQEIEIAADVFRSSMRRRLSDRVRISNVHAAYLADQGVLISMDAARPWITMDGLSERSLQIGRDFDSIHQIPEMVQEILAELKIAVGPYEPEELEELRELRQEQRELRAEQRKIRGKLREERRKLSRSPDDRLEKIAAKINELQRELAANDVEYYALEHDIDAQYERLHDVRANQSDRQPDTVELDAAVGTTACMYGATLRGIASDHHLTVAVNFSEASRYYVFEMKHVDACHRADIDAAQLLERSYVYNNR